jgi:SAM-dependent methyltransferase
MLHDPWLSRWLPLLHERAGGSVVLEIGCGHGEDTSALTSAGLRVHAFDLSQAAIKIAQLRVPTAVVECRDVRDPLPEYAGELGVIIASLSLHYFSWADTATLVRRIRSALRVGGVFLCRLNSTEDHNFGATGHPEIETNFFLVNGEPKRFFNKASVQSLFAEGWDTLSLEHFTTKKYIKTKALWEIAVVRRDV